MLLFLIALLSSVIGAVCGIGGGVIIKPVLDLLGVASVATISFLSSCTVFSMSLYNVGRSLASRSGSGSIDTATGTPLALGAALGGVCGNLLFAAVRNSIGGSVAGAAQSLCLLLLTLGTFAYTLKKDKIHARQESNPLVCVVIGLLLGLLSSFLGIGGGPFNLVVLHYFFSMDTKKAAANSLYIILFSQAANLRFSLVGGTSPAFEPSALLLMVCGGVGGGILGRMLSKRMDDRMVDKLFLVLLLLISLICVYNAVNFIR